MKSHHIIYLILLSVILVSSFAFAEDADRDPAPQNQNNTILALGDKLWGPIDIQTQADDNQLLGCEWDGEHYWVTGGNTGQQPNKLYKYDADFNLIQTTDQPTNSSWGWRDLAWDGEFLYAGDDGTVVHQISIADGLPTGVTIPKPAGITVTRALAYDPETDHFWTANFSSSIVEFDRNGAVINTFANTKSAYGMAWDNVSADGPWLWVHSQNGTPYNGMQVSQFNPVTGVYTGIEFQAEEVNGPSPNGDIAGGAAFFVDDFNAPLGAILLLGQGGGIGYDYLSCFEITEAGGETPCCDVDMTPDDDPVIVEPGGRFGFTGYIGNPTPDPITTDVWGGVRYQGTVYQQFSFNNIPLNPGQFLTAHSWQNVPGFAPQGTYGYVAYCGDRPSVKCDSAEFPFTVVAGRGGNAAEWSIDGEFLGAGTAPIEYALIGSCPNPFNASTTITFELPAAGNVNLEVYNLMGQKVATLVDGQKDAGQHSINWNAADQASGVYFYKLSAGEKVFTQRVTLLK